MPVSSVSTRLFPAVYGRRLQVEPAGQTTDDSYDRDEAILALKAVDLPSDPPPTEAIEVVDALLDALDDAELAALEELSTEDIEVLARQLQLKGVHRRHLRGFVEVLA